jgi:hypothetical protein
MTLHRRFKPILPLTAKMKVKGGIHSVEAIRRADKSLEAMREDCLASIDGILDRLDVQARLQRSSPTDIELLYRSSSDILDLCGPAGQVGLENAARSLCDYLDRIAEGEPLDLRGVNVHVAAMRMLHRTQASNAERAAVLEGLSQLTTLQARPAPGGLQ